MAEEKLTLQQQVALCRQIARLAQAKLPLIDHLSTVAQDETMDTYQASLKVQHDLSQGKSLKDSLVQNDSTDSRILSACLEVGQNSNCLDQALESWTAMHIANRRANLSLRTAMLYPLTLILITLIAVGWTAWYLIPQIESAFLQFDRQPPIWLRWIFYSREWFVGTAIVAVLMVVTPLLYWQWRRTRIDQFGVPRSLARRSRLQSLASRLAGWQLAAGRPLSEVLPLCLTAMGTSGAQSRRAFQDLRLHRSLAAMSMETTMVLASLHCGIVTRDQAVNHCLQIGQRLEDHANLYDQQECRWLPVLVALVTGAVTLATYGLLIYLPWVSLMVRISEPQG